MCVPAASNAAGWYSQPAPVGTQGQSYHILAGLEPSVQVNLELKACTHAGPAPGAAPALATLQTVTFSLAVQDVKSADAAGAQAVEVGSCPIHW